MLNPKLARQSLGRDMTAWERDFAAALEAAFATGHHEPDAVARALTAAGFPNAQGTVAAWTAATVHQTLVALNKDLDAAYREAGIGA
jgi:hypothetical protein